MLLLSLILIIPFRYMEFEYLENYGIITIIYLLFLVSFYLLFFDMKKYFTKYNEFLDRIFIKNINDILGIVIFKYICDFLFLYSVLLKGDYIFFTSISICLSLQIVLLLVYTVKFFRSKGEFIERIIGKTAFAEGVMDRDEGEFYGEFVRMFMDERTQNAENKNLKVDKLYDMYAEWSQMTGTLTLHKDIFIEKLKEFNYKLEQKNDKLYVQNISTDLIY